MFFTDFIKNFRKMHYEIRRRDSNNQQKMKEAQSLCLYLFVIPGVQLQSNSSDFDFRQTLEVVKC